ncbi:hypothetical protein [Aeromonas phage AS-yj]|uniref:Uncharacterized protein n=2 Tax=Ceceduovirus TaxID=2842588 RepID=A0A291LF04_9CAUD|nr:hypothetical protein HWB29_gp365 [Aeromonas phage AS-sw]ATI17931.1 hypothetical protein [Aeromonas phage AS-yj]ATI18415.1 hypothetical protein [Aeromonas phage AS-sw]
MLDIETIKLIRSIINFGKSSLDTLTEIVKNEEADLDNKIETISVKLSKIPLDDDDFSRYQVIVKSNGMFGSVNVGIRINGRGGDEYKKHDGWITDIESFSQGIWNPIKVDPSGYPVKIVKILGPHYKYETTEGRYFKTDLDDNGKHIENSCVVVNDGQKIVDNANVARRPLYFHLDGRKEQFENFTMEISIKTPIPFKEKMVRKVYSFQKNDWIKE